MKYLLLYLVLVSLLVWCYCNPCTEFESVDITTGVVHANGSITHDNVEYGPGRWYKGELENGATVTYGCPCIDHVCINKCCGRTQAFLNRSCENTDSDTVNPFSPTVYKGRVPTNVTASEHFYYFYRRPCNDSYGVDPSSSTEELFIQENGTLYEVAQGGSQWHPSSRYCVDMSIYNNSVASSLVAAVCYPDSVSSDDNYTLYIAYAVGLLLSVPFLLATFLVYAMIPELRNLHGMCLMAYCAGLIVGYPFLSYLKLHVGRIGANMTGCIVSAFFVYYAFQTTFFWLNVMCFDIWRTFSGYRGGSMNKRRETRRFAIYGIYAWGVPALLTAFTMIMQLSENIPSYLITPGFGQRKCWFVDFKSELLYFYPSVLTLVVVNVILFSVTAYRIRSIRQETAILKGSESSRSDKLKKDKQRYSLYLKLFVVMGVNWTIEVIGFAVGGSNYYWILIDISNIGLGIFIFLIFVWKKKVRNLIRKRFQQIRGQRVSSDGPGIKWTTSSAPTEDTRVSGDESLIRLKELR